MFWMMLFVCVVVFFLEATGGETNTVNLAREMDCDTTSHKLRPALTHVADLC